MTIRTAAMALISALNRPEPIAWPGINFPPPATGAWLEVELFENDPQQPGLPNGASSLPRGFLQVTVCARPGAGFVPLDTIADAIIAGLPKGTSIDGVVRIVQTPYKLASLSQGDRLSVPVTVPYSA